MDTHRPPERGQTAQRGLRVLARGAGLALAALTASCWSSSTSSPGDTTQIGLLLPFTGKQASLGENIERVLILQKDTINSAGGIAGKPLAFTTRDTHSDPERGQWEATSLVEDGNVIALLGPEEPEIAKAVSPLLVRRDLIEVLPGVAAPSSLELGDQGLWYRISPSPAVVAGALAERIAKDQVKSLAIFYSSDPFGSTLSQLLQCEFLQAGGTSVIARPISGKHTADSSVLGDVLTFHPDAVALLLYPPTGATVVREWYGLGPDVKWYLSPTLETNEFLKNTPSGSLTGALGISSGLQWFAGGMATVFEERWHDFPLTAAYYYYDAVSVLALAVEAASFAEGGGRPSTPAIRDALRRVSTPPGRMISWDNLGEGLRAVRQGEDINYEGLTGPVDIDEGGNVEQSLLRSWRIVNDSIQRSSLPFDYSQFLSSGCEHSVGGP